MKSLFVVAAILIAACAEPYAIAVDGALGVCESSVERERKTAPYKVGSQNKMVSDFEAEQPCSGGTIRIKKCAVIKIRDQKIQRYCFPKDDKPQYSEYFDVIEYWEVPVRKPSVQ